MTYCNQCSWSLNSNQLPQLDFYTFFPTNVRQLVRQMSALVIPVSVAVSPMPIAVNTVQLA